MPLTDPSFPILWIPPPGSASNHCLGINSDLVFGDIIGGTDFGFGDCFG